MSSDEKKTFYIGICMAGAVSAGAYTAGVIDYLLEALHDWQDRKNAKGPNVPKHNVVIPVIGGASAGGMTGIITGAAIQSSIQHVTSFPVPLTNSNAKNSLYNAWVDLEKDDMFPMMLNTDDIKEKQIYSLLNSDFIERIAERVTKVNGNIVERPYIDKHLRIFTTLSNLNGIPYNAAFRCNSPDLNKYLMSMHHDYAGFILNKKENEYEKDGWIPLDFRNNVNVSIACQAAMATGAFPIGLRARKVMRKNTFVNENRWHKSITSRFPIMIEDYETLNVDGGLINNEPFEKVRDVLNEITQEGLTIKDGAGRAYVDYQDYNTFKSTVLMIDPFPSEAGEFNNNDGLLNVIGNTLSAMINHLRIKHETIQDAMDSSQAGQFLITPSRTRIIKRKEEQVYGSKAIACGCLGGFGGFIHKHFRIHDFFLGRANCEKFLRDYFTVPINTTNPIFTEGYEDIADKTPFISRLDGGLQIIPIFKKESSEVPLPTFYNQSTWPAISEKEVERFRPLIKKRAQTLIMNLDNYNVVTRFLIWAGAKIILNRKITDMVMSRLMRSLREHDLLK